MCDCSRHTGGKAPETFPTGQSAARSGARISGTLHDRLNASSTNYDAAAAHGPPTPREGGWAFRWLCCRCLRPSAPLMFPGTIEQTGGGSATDLSDACPKAGRRHINAGWLGSGTNCKYTPFPTGRRKLDPRGIVPFRFVISVSPAPSSPPFPPALQLSRG